MVKPEAANRITIQDVANDPWSNVGYESPPNYQSSATGLLETYISEISSRISLLESDTTALERSFKERGLRNLSLLIDIEGVPIPNAQSRNFGNKSPDSSGPKDESTRTSISAKAAEEQDDITSLYHIIREDDQKEFMSCPEKISKKVLPILSEKQYDSGPIPSITPLSTDGKGGKFFRWFSKGSSRELPKRRFSLFLLKS